MTAGKGTLTIEQGATLDHRFAVTVGGVVIDTAGYAGELHIRDRKESATTLLELTTANGRILLGIQPADWAATTAYAVGERVIPTTPNGFMYRASVAGTSGAGEPTWPTTIGQTVVDGTVTWENVAAFTESARYNVHWLVSAATIDALDWDALDEQRHGRFDFKLLSGSYAIREVEGFVVWSKAVTT